MQLENKYVSFAIYGKIQKYLNILEYNIRILTKYNYKVVLYCDIENIDFLKSYFPTILIMNGNKYGLSNKMLWRLNPLFDNFAYALFPRDADSKITDREIFLMQDFILSNKNFHIIRDHELHFMPIMGGLFGLKKQIYYIFKQERIFKKLKKVKNLYNYDQLFLSDYIYPIVLESSLIHTSSYSYKNEPHIEITKSLEYCGMYDNLDVAKFNHKIDYLNIINRKPIYYIIAKLFRYKWFLFIKKSIEK